MGDRRNIVIKHNDQCSVALYSHWDGSNLPWILARALTDGAMRYTDPAYFTRIVFSRMIEDDVHSETGYGIEPFRTGTTAYCEAAPGYDLIVDLEAGTVTGDDDGEGTVLTFEQYLAHFGCR